MIKNIRSAVSLLLAAVIVPGGFIPAGGCADNYIHPVFAYRYAPENPFENFAAGRIGIVKPTYRRVVLFAAYRYLNGGGFSAAEQRALVVVWNAEFKNEEPPRPETAEKIEKWLRAREAVTRDEKNVPAIFTQKRLSENEYAFFPNCGADAFETAAETLSDRQLSNGADDPFVAEWLRAQDLVFENCAGRRQIPAAPDETYPAWLRKDREYQIAAAEFYATKFVDARKRFAAIAEDPESPWRETADYLVGRTLVREAGFTKDGEARKALYEAAERRLETINSLKFAESARKLVNLIRLRVRPEERVGELGRSLIYPENGEQLRQDLIDYTWLLDKFDATALKAEEKRKDDEEIARFAAADAKMQREVSAKLEPLGEKVEVVVLKGKITVHGLFPESEKETVLRAITDAKPREFDNQLVFKTVNSDGSVTYSGNGGNDFLRRQNGFLEKWQEAENGESIRVELYKPEYRIVYFPPDASDREIFEKLTEGKKEITDEDRANIQIAISEARANSIANRFSAKPQPDYEGEYYGEEVLTSALVPEFLRRDELTDWLYTYQLPDERAYLHALESWRAAKSDLWLTTALVKARKDLPGLAELLPAADKISPNSPAFPTVAYHRARILFESGKKAEAAAVVDAVLGSPLDLPVSTRNEFAALRLKTAETLDAFLRNSVRRPFTFADYGQSTTIDEAIERRKTWDENAETYYAQYKIWENRAMFDDDSVAAMNEHFPLEILADAPKSNALPEYLREKLLKTVWTRAVILQNDEILRKIAPELVKTVPEAADFLAAANGPERRRAALFVIFRHPDFTPFLTSGVNRNYATFDESAGYWCPTSGIEYDRRGNEIPRRLPPTPAFLNESQAATARLEKKQLDAVGSGGEFLYRQALGWLKAAPADKRLPESLFRAAEANIPYNYGCGNADHQIEIIKLMKARFPKSPWTTKASGE